jgi:hypothetical protein
MGTARSGVIVLLGVLAPALLLECGSSGASSSTTAGDTVFAEHFETGSLAAWNDGIDPSRQRIVEDSDRAHSGSHFLAVTYPAGADGGWLTRFLRPGFDSLYVSLWVRFPETWQGDTKLIALYGSRTDNEWSAFGQAGKCPMGSDFFASMLVADQTTTRGTGELRFYTYYPAMAREPDGVTCWGRFGDGSETYEPVAMTNGAWHHVEFCVRLNQPGRADARQTVWVDGKQRGTWSGFSFRKGEILRLDAVQLTFSRGLGGTPSQQQLDIDDVTVKIPCTVKLG